MNRKKKFAVVLNVTVTTTLSFITLKTYTSIHIWPKPQIQHGIYQQQALIFNLRGKKKKQNPSHH